MCVIFFQAEDGIRDWSVTGVQTCALPISVVDALAGQRKVETKIEIGMRLGVIGNFRKPRAGNHNARGVDEAGVESLDRCGVYRMSDANIVGVNDQELCIAGKAESFGKSLASVLGV